MKPSKLFFNFLLTVFIFLSSTAAYSFFKPDPTPERCTCKYNFVQNGGFSNGVAGTNDNINDGNVPGWEAAYVNPQYITTDGYTAPGYIQMWGNKMHGEAIKQKVVFKKGTTYNICFAFRSDEADVDYVRFKLRASNRNDISNPNMGTVIGISQNAHYDTNNPDEWHIANLTWTADDNYSILYVSPENDVDAATKPVSFGHIDDICIQEAESKCDGFVEMKTTQISGPTQIIMGAGSTYSVPNYPDLHYTWSLSHSVQFTGQGTNSITVPGASSMTKLYFNVKVLIECNGKQISKEIRVKVIPKKQPPKKEDINKTNPAPSPKGNGAGN